MQTPLGRLTKILQPAHGSKLKKALITAVKSAVLRLSTSRKR
jgi:hypothetical protein